jgi:hypothetical protein
MRLGLNTTSGLMGVVAGAAIVVATYSAFENEEGNPLLGLLTVLACTAGVAGLRSADAIKGLRASGEPATVRRISTTILKSCVVAALIVGLADLAFLLTYGFVAGGPRFFLFSTDRPPRDLIPEGLIAGGVMGLAVCYLSRRGFWGSTPVRGRLRSRLAPLAVVVLLLGANVMRQRNWYRGEQAQRHDIFLGEYGDESELPTAPRTPGFRLTAEMAAYHARMRAYHAWMKRKWERAASDPWLPVEPNPPPPVHTPALRLRVCPLSFPQRPRHLRRGPRRHAPRGPIRCPW